MKPTHAFHRFLTLALAGLLLLLHGSSSQLVRVAEPVRAESGAANKSQKTPDTPQPVVKAATDDAVVAPALSFDFSQVTYLLPLPCFRLLAQRQPLLRRAHEIPYFYFSYLRHVFEHVVAPNAP